MANRCAGCLMTAVGVLEGFDEKIGAQPATLCTDKQCQMAPPLAAPSSRAAPAPVDEVTAEAKSLWAAIAAEEAREGAGVQSPDRRSQDRFLRARNLFGRAPALASPRLSTSKIASESRRTEAKCADGLLSRRKPIVNGFDGTPIVEPEPPPVPSAVSCCHGISGEAHSTEWKRHRRQVRKRFAR
jgi:hypothetical protein